MITLVNGRWGNESINIYKRLERSGCLMTTESRVCPACHIDLYHFHIYSFVLGRVAWLRDSKYAAQWSATRLVRFESYQPSLVKWRRCISNAYIGICPKIHENENISYCDVLQRHISNGYLKSSSLATDVPRLEDEQIIHVYVLHGKSDISDPSIDQNVTRWYVGIGRWERWYLKIFIIRGQGNVESYTPRSALVPNEHSWHPT